MLVQVEKPYTDFIDKMINLGFADDANEVVKQSLLIYQSQIEFEELYSVDKAVKSEMNNIRTVESSLVSVENVFKEAGI